MKETRRQDASGFTVFECAVAGTIVDCSALDDVGPLPQVHFARSVGARDWHYEQFGTVEASQQVYPRAPRSTALIVCLD